MDRQDAERLREPRQALAHRRQLGREGYTNRRRYLMVQPGLRSVERRGHEEDGPIVLVRNGSADRERAPVAHVLHAVDDRRRRVAGPDEVPVQGVDGTNRIDRTAGAPPAEPALGPDRRADATNRRVVQLLQVEHLEQEVDRGLPGRCVSHGGLLYACSASEPILCTRTVFVEPGVFAGVPATMTT